MNPLVPNDSHHLIRQGMSLALLGVLALLITSCAHPRGGDAPNSTGAAHKASLPERSLYQVSSSWTNDLNQAQRLTALSGRPQVVTLFFTKCEYACPALVHDMKAIEDALPAELRPRVGFTLITFDTERDTPATLAAYRAVHALPPHWSLLQGGPDDTLELAALLGVKFKKDARGQFAHSNILSLLNAQGELLYQQVSLNQKPEAMAERIVREMTDKHP